MELQHINVKIFVDGALKIAPARFIDVFHQWIKDEVMDELLIDVADYRHVPNGPGVFVIGHEADYSFDQRGGRDGLRYNRKAAVEGDNAARFAQALGSAARACRMLEERFAKEGPLRFDRGGFELYVNDRALAPNTDETFAACRPELDAFLKKAVGDCTITRKDADDPRRCFGVTVATAKPLDFAGLEKLIAAKG